MACPPRAAGTAREDARWPRRMPASRSPPCLRGGDRSPERVATAEIASPASGSSSAFQSLISTPTPSPALGACASPCFGAGTAPSLHHSHGGDRAPHAFHLTGSLDSRLPASGTKCFRACRSEAPTLGRVPAASWSLCPAEEKRPNIVGQVDAGLSGDFEEFSAGYGSKITHALRVTTAQQGPSIA